MATRTPHTGVALEVLTAANLAKYPKGNIGYAERTSDFALTDSDTDINGLTLTLTIGANRRIRIRGHGLFDVSAAGAANFSGYIKQSTTQLGYFARGECDASEQVLGAGAVEVNVTSPGSYTWKLSAQRTAGSGVVTVVASSTNPAYITVDDIGPSYS